MAETSSKSPIIDYKQARAKEVQEVLVKVTGQEKWRNTESWKFYLVHTPQMSDSKLPTNSLKKSRNAIFNDIARSPEFRGLGWHDPDSWDPLEKEYCTRSRKEAKQNPREGEMPLWAVQGDWMLKYPEIVRWMRREHWRNNKAKLKELFEQGIALVYA